MAEYSYVKENGEFLIKERATGYTVRYFFDLDQTKKFIKHLNSGGAFAGWTPNFFLVERYK
jgi:hypothetical protein